MVDDVTCSTRTASAGTRVDAPLVAAGSVTGTVGVHSALWSTATVRVSKVVGLTRACSIVAVGIRSTRRWIAWVRRHWFLLYCKHIRNLLVY